MTSSSEAGGLYYFERGPTDLHLIEAIEATTRSTVVKKFQNSVI